jgi:hypothetical protein
VADAIALIVAGTGEVSEREVNDLLLDAYPEDLEEVGLIVPVDKDLYSKAVQYAVAWFNDDENVVPIQTKGASLTRASAKLGGNPNEQVDKFAQILLKSEFDDWDEVHFLVAMPEDEDDPDYDYYAELVEAAIAGGLQVKNLCRGLDDVTLAEPEDKVQEPEPEPEVVEEKPAPKRRSRARAAAPVEEPEPEPAADEPDPEPEPAPEKPKRRSRAAAKPVEEPEPATADTTEVTLPSDLENRFGFHPATEVTRPLHEEVRAKAREFAETLDALLSGNSREKSTAITKVEEAMFWANAHIARYGAPLESAGSEPTPKAEEPTTASSRGRGRPRQNFEVRQIWDEDAQEWIPRPKGRVAKGTGTRTIHAESGEVLEEGTA